MKVKISKWGNSLGLRLPKAVSDELGLNAGRQLDLVVEQDEIRLRKPRAVSSAELLAEMVAEAKRLGPQFEPETVEWGPDVGTEVIDDAYSRGEITLADVLGHSESSENSQAPQRPKQNNATGRRRHRMG
jgi:antitoxin MazE